MTARTRWRVACGAVTLAGTLAVLACNPQELAERQGGIQRLSIATGGTGGVYYPYDGGIAKIISQHLDGVEATAEVTAASVDNLKFLRDGKSDIVFTMADTLDDALSGRGAFDAAPVPARALAVLYPNYTHVVTVEGNGIDTLADLRGRVVSTGSPGSGTEVIALKIFAALGLDPTSDVQTQSLGVSQSVDALKDGKVDAFFWGGGLPTAAVLDLASSPGVTMKMISSEEVVAPLNEFVGSNLYYEVTIPASTYPGQADDVRVVAVSNVLTVHERLADDLAELITRALFEHHDELVAIHPQARELTLETATTSSTAPFHPGAIEYYRAMNAWRP